MAVAIPVAEGTWPCWHCLCCRHGSICIKLHVAQFQRNTYTVFGFWGCSRQMSDQAAYTTRVHLSHYLSHFRGMGRLRSRRLHGQCLWRACFLVLNALLGGHHLPEPHF